MRVVSPAVELRGPTLEDALEQALGDAAMRAAAGGHLVSITPWDADGQRTVVRRVPLPGAPALLHGLFLGGAPGVTATARQSLRGPPGCERWEVHSSVQLHMRGGALLQLAPRFVLQRGAEGRRPTVHLEADVRARLPPPLRGVVERFAAHALRREFQALAATVAAA